MAGKFFVYSQAGAVKVTVFILAVAGALAAGSAWLGPAKTGRG
jgi:uncharacterized membrane protein